MNVFFVSVKNKIFCKRNKEDDKNHKRKIRVLIWSICVAVMLMIVSAVYVSMHTPSHSYCEGVGEYSLSASSEKDRVVFFAPFGYSAKEIESTDVIIPSSGEVLQEYNEIQKSQGLDILPFGDKAAKLYVFELEKEGNTEYGFMTVYKGRVVAAHISDLEYPARIKSLKG